MLRVLDGQARKVVDMIGSNSLFYATALKALKKDLETLYLKLILA